MVAAGESGALRILQVGTMDEGGGAAAVATSLMHAYRARGHNVWHAVGQKRGDDSHVFVLPDDRRLPYRASGYTAVQAGLRRLAGRYPNRGWGLMRRSLRSLTHPRAVAARMTGAEDFEFPGTYALLDLVDSTPDVVHCHNLHGEYFDLRALSWLSRRVPTVLTLHDMWLLTGHCAYSLGCERWKTGCGSCPDLRLYPSVRRDATASNWQRKRQVYEQSRISVATPSQWLLDRVEQSMLAPTVQHAKVIPNGVDLSVFQPGDRRAARRALGLPPDAAIVLLTAGSRGSMWKDDRTAVAAMERLATARLEPWPLFVALGRDDALARKTRADVRLVPYQTKAPDMARYYQAADVYLHSARADTFPSAVLEALACGTPVVATDVGGIAEQVRTDGRATGLLVPQDAPGPMADAVIALLSDNRRRLEMGRTAAADARARFDQERQVEAYLEWYREIADDWKARS